MKPSPSVACAGGPATAAALCSAHTGWKERRSRNFNARLVRVIDFERALTRLPQERQALLLLTYRERQPQDTIARLTVCSVRAISYKLPEARRALGRTRDLLDLL